MKNKPVQFIENKGQMVDMNGNPIPFVLFKIEAEKANMYLTETGLTYVFLKSKRKTNQGLTKFDIQRTKVNL